MKLEIIENMSEFTKIAHEWDAVLVKSSADNPFQSYAWLHAWWHVYGHGKPYILLCRDESTNELVGGLPLYVSNIAKCIPIKVLKILGSGKGSADFLGCLALVGRERDVHEAIDKHFHGTQNYWDLIELQAIDVESSFGQYIKNSGLQGLVSEIQQTDRCPYLQLPGTWDDLVKGLSKKVRQRVGYYRRSLDKIGAVELEQITDVEMLPDALTDMIRLRQDRLDQKGLSSKLVTDAYCKFHEQLMPAFLRDNRLQLCFLRVDGQRIAYMYLFTGGNGVYFYQTGFDRAWANQSVGFVLLGKVIEQAIADGYENFEFLRGEEKYKYEWGQVSERELIQICISNNGAVARLYLLIEKALRQVRQLKRRLSGDRGQVG